MFRAFRCFSSYAVGSYVAYGEPLASSKHSSDKDNDSVQEMYNERCEHLFQLHITYI